VLKHICSKQKKNIEQMPISAMRQQQLQEQNSLRLGQVSLSEWLAADWPRRLVLCVGLARREFIQVGKY